MKIVLYLHIVHHNLHQSMGPMTGDTRGYELWVFSDAAGQSAAETALRAQVWARQRAAVQDRGGLGVQTGPQAAPILYYRVCVACTVGTQVDAGGGGQWVVLWIAPRDRRAPHLVYLG